jgi:hypothetical protein
MMMANSEFLPTPAHSAVPTELLGRRQKLDATAHTRKSRNVSSPDSASAAPEETVVVDDRCDVSPAEMVESKLTSMLKEASLPVSHLQMRGMLRKR